MLHYQCNRIEAVYMCNSGDNITCYCEITTYMYINISSFGILLVENQHNIQQLHASHDCKLNNLIKNKLNNFKSYTFVF